MHDVIYMCYMCVNVLYSDLTQGNINTCLFFCHKNRFLQTPGFLAYLHI